MSNQKPQLSTLSVHAGEERYIAERATQVPIFLSAAFGYETVEEWMDTALGRTQGHIYSRNTNPTVAAFEEKVRQLEGAEAATSFASGMAAISNTLWALLKPGDRVVSIKDTYGGTNKLFIEFLPRYQIEVALCDTNDVGSVEAALQQGCRILYLETPTNPTLKVVDIARLAEAAHKVGAIVVVDNTVGTPINQTPIALGADIVIHSATKFLGGHADALGGVACGDDELIEQIYHYREINGAVLDPMSAYLLLRGMKTLDLRIQRQNESALKIAQFLETQPNVGQVNYPGLASSPYYQIAKAQMHGGYGGMLSFALKGGFAQVKKFLPLLHYAHLAANLGAVETVAGPPATTSHVEETPEERAAMGIPEGLVRYSVGIESVDDLIDDLDQALKQV